jgi:4'-phosphopantetheinyl transferase
VSVRVHQALWPVDDLVSQLAAQDAVICSASLFACEPLERVLEVLSASEQVRYEEYGNSVVRRRFACGRFLLREMLGRALGVSPRDVPLREGLHGKPCLAAGTSRPVWFSVSHCDDLLVVAMSRKADVGIDVERSRAFEQWQRVADRVLDPSERRELAAAVEDGEDPGDAFLRHWCRVEAELKAIGCGIAGLEAHRAGERPRGLRITDLPTLPVPPDVAGGRYQAAVALCTPGADMRRPSASASAHDATPTTRPASASTA